ncbi:LysM peptidoglycan-binding domain-containing protein [Arthrobacter cheniae]|nr:LysM peptidoglycan-binding domain-containing protein [Arthrobacter cheniae]
MSQGARMGRQATVIIAGSGLLLSMAAPAQASATSSGTYSETAALESPFSLPSGAVSTSAAGSVYTVQPGDTLGLISAQNQVNLETLLAANNLTISSIIYPGDSIKLTASSAGAPAEQPQQYSSARIQAQVQSGISVQSATIAPIGQGSETASTSINQAILGSAKAQLGAIQDCTVLGEVALRAAGIQGVGDESPESLMSYATQVSDPQPGDFVYYADGGMGYSHNAVYLGGGRAIHSGWNGNQTIEESVNVGSGPIYYRVNG